MTETAEATPATGRDDGLIAAWIAALRSGRHEQGTSALRDRDDRYCCLGEACDLVVEREPGMRWVPGDQAMGTTWGIDMGDGRIPERVYLPPAIAARLGLTVQGGRPDGRPWRIGRRDYDTLVAANDRGGESFAAIAGAVEAWHAEVLAAEAGAGR